MAKRRIEISVEHMSFDIQSDHGFTHFDCDLTFEVDNENEHCEPIEFSNVWLFRGKKAPPECLSSFAFKFGDDGCDLDSISEAIRSTCFESEMLQAIEDERKAQLERDAEAAYDAVMDGLA